MAKLSTDSYKGVRDFYPEDMFVQQYIFGVWRRVAERYGYQEYAASVLEPTELYRNKTSEEIVNDQTYTFLDRGQREVTLRPEMTPTVARMVAARRREVGFPLRLYSIPNLFRYEQPQRGRLREHWQLNVDVFGITSIEAGVEIITMASDIMKEFGAKPKDFEFVINSRKLNAHLLGTKFNLNEDEIKAVSRIIDRKEKVDAKTFEKMLSEHLSPADAASLSKLIAESALDAFSEMQGADDIKRVMANLAKAGITNVRFSAALMRGFDYYTGIVFEVFDTDPANRRSLFGGGRYDNLLAMFGGESVPAVGFGMGDVTIHDFLETHKLLPAYESTARLGLCPLNASLFEHTAMLARALRAAGVNVSVDWTGRKVGDQIKAKVKLSIPFAVVIGPEEAKSGWYKVKELATSKETAAKADEIPGIIAAARAAGAVPRTQQK